MNLIQFMDLVGTELRLKVLMALRDHGCLTTDAITGATGGPRSAVSKALTDFRRFGICLATKPAHLPGQQGCGAKPYIYHLAREVRDWLNATQLTVQAIMRAAPNECERARRSSEEAE